MFNGAELATFIAHGLGSSPRLAYAIVRNSKGSVTFAEVARQMGVSTDRAQKACNVLRDAGLVNINFVRNRGYQKPAEVSVAGK